MNKEELQKYKWNSDLNIKEESKKENFGCSDCSGCSDCLYCRNLENKRGSYYICNVEVTKEEFEKKLKEIKNEK